MTGLIFKKVWMNIYTLNLVIFHGISLKWVILQRKAEFTLNEFELIGTLIMTDVYVHAQCMKIIEDICVSHLISQMIWEK